MSKFSKIKRILSSSGGYVDSKSVLAILNYEYMVKVLDIFDMESMYLVHINQRIFRIYSGKYMRNIVEFRRNTVL